MKKLLAILLGACLLLGVMTGCGGNAEDAVTVQKVSDITSQGSVGLVNRYAGIVVSGETATVKKGDKKVLETYVKEGDFVTEGDVLFCYDNEAMELQLSKLLLELEGYENTISNAEEDIPNLERQRDAAPAAQQLTYSLQIQELQANVREATYNKGLKEREIENLQEALRGYGRARTDLRPRDEREEYGEYRRRLRLWRRYERQRRLHHHHGHDDLSGQGHDQRAERRHAFRGDERAYPFTP